MESKEIKGKNIDFHANWKLEETRKSFKSLKQSIIEHREDTKSFTIEALFFESYLYISDFRGNKNIVKAKELNEKAFNVISELSGNESIKNGYKSIYLALKCLFATDQSEREDIYGELKSLLTVYEDAAKEERRKFQASVHATKGFALSRLKCSRYEESETEMKQATEICPENVEWKFMLGLITWRRNKLNLYKFEWSDGMNRTEKIMDEVLKQDVDHAYAKTILADIHRRKYEQHCINMSSTGRLVHGLIFDNVENPCIAKILNLLSEAKENACKPRILSLIAKCYIQMNDCRCRRLKGKLSCSQQPKCNLYLKKAHDVIQYTKQNYGESACIFVQEAVLYREKNDINKQLECLENAIRLEPSDSAAKMQKAKALAALKKHEDARAVYDNLLFEFKDDPFVFFDVNQNYARYFVSIQEFEKAIVKNQVCLNIAVESFVKSENAPIEFNDEQQGQADKVIEYLKKYLKPKLYYSNVNEHIEYARLHEKIREFKVACSYYKKALQEFERMSDKDHDQELLTETRLKFAEMNLKIGNLDGCSDNLVSIKNDKCTKEQDNLRQQLRMDLLIAKGCKLAKSGDNRKAIDMFTQSTEMGSVNAAILLLEETKKMENGQLRMSALKSIASVTKGNENWSKQFNLKQELAKLLPSCDDGSLMGQELKTLRNNQLEMEYSILMDDDNISANISIVLQQGHNILNHAMEHFRNKHYPTSKARSVDFIIIPKVTPPETVEQRVQKILEKRQWKGFRNKFKLLLIYLVSIQPATNAEFKWLKDFVDLNNDDKHRRPVENSSETIYVARNMCSNIEEILEEIYKWCCITEKEPWIK